MIYIQQKFVSNYQALLASCIIEMMKTNTSSGKKIDFKDFPSTLMNC